MNEHQEAFNNIKDSHRKVKGGLSWFDEDVRTVQELIDKEKPMRPLKQYPIDWGIGNYGWCDVCNHGVNYQQNRCDNCGQKLDWSDEDE